MKVKEEREKASLKLNIQKPKMEGEKVEAVTDFIFLGSKITVNSDWRHKIKNACFMENKLWQIQTTY